ncbi:hypothetical protein PA905_39400 [Planktothrix agardhii CCAP 1459/11A]|uniref:Uncharacterized protein n=1 Tax=Planktothrix agardhii CCAP 1459/11A TaxID=282420 RepID=A0A4P5ZH52_PLAAG|nr:hypothetical protein PA905_39400 [Planktothrix agardhii CCAP 1459/11A]
MPSYSDYEILCYDLRFLVQSLKPAVDILAAVKRTVIPKLHNLGFCFLATASTHKEFSGLMFAPQTIPASPAVLMCRSLKKRILKFVLILGVDCPLPYPHFPGLPIFLRRQYNWASLVRLSESIVTGGSVTIHILTQSLSRT